MSWSLQVPPTLRAEFNAAVDAAIPTGDNASTMGGAKQIAAAVKIMKELAAQVVRPRVVGIAGGHALQPDDGANFYDGMSVSVSGLE
jgi:hypothetical protein